MPYTTTLVGCDAMLSATASKERRQCICEILSSSIPCGHCNNEYTNEVQDSPNGNFDSGETYSESEMSFRDSRSVSPQNDEYMTSESERSTPQSQKLIEDATFERDRKLVQDRFQPHDLFPADNAWDLQSKVDLLLSLSPNKNYTKDDLMNIDSLSAEEKVEMLISLAAKTPANFRWNYVEPSELTKSYTVVTNCKKEKKKDSEGNSSPKRPMNAFMIWSMKCRGIIAQICPQLHNAIISTQLGKAWRQFTDEEKAIYEREKETLTAFHRYEFPDYKYKPRKKPKKSEEKPAPAPKPKANKRKRNENCQPTTLLGIDISDSHQNCDPVLKERLQTKVHKIKIDPNYKKVHAKKDSLIRIADNCYAVTETESVSPPPMKTLRFDTNYTENNQSHQEDISTQPLDGLICQQDDQPHFMENTICPLPDIKPVIVDGKVIEETSHLSSFMKSFFNHPTASSVFLTPENSPSDPTSPETNRSFANFSYESDFLSLDMQENNNNDIKSEPFEDTEFLLKTLPLPVSHYSLQDETEPNVSIPETADNGSLSPFLQPNVVEDFFNLIDKKPIIKTEICAQQEDTFENRLENGLRPARCCLDDLPTTLISA